MHAVLQLQSTGVQDTYLTLNPQINVFKYTYYRYVNFASEITSITLNESAAFGRKTSVVIPKKGHLLANLYLHLRLPPLQKSGGTYASWTDSLGHAILETVEFEVNGIVVDRLYDVCLDIFDELTSSKHGREGKSLMLLKSDIYVANKYNAGKAIDLFIPLEFWFTKAYNLSLPLLSMQNQELRVNFKFKDFSDLINYDDTYPPARVDILDSSIYAEYVFLDEVILDQFQKTEHKYLVDQVQYAGAEVIPAGTTNTNVTLKFNHPVKALYFVFVDNDSTSNNDYFNYSRRDDGEPFLLKAALMCDGRYRFDYLPETYLRTAFPHRIHSVIPNKRIYVLPFSARPEDNQPTGTLNFSRFDNVDLSLRLNTDNPTCTLHVFALNYNIVSVSNGFLLFEFSV